MCYNPIISRYVFLTTGTSGYFDSVIRESSVRVLEAPHPWGPWTVILDENMTDAYKDRGAGLGWAYFMQKFMGADGKKMWLSVTPKSYSLGFIPMYLTTAEPAVYEAEDASLSGGAAAVTARHPFPGFYGRGYVTGFHAEGADCGFCADIGTAGRYIAKLRYMCSYTRGEAALFVNGGLIRTLRLGLCHKDYYPDSGWTDLSVLIRLDKGLNVVSVRSTGTDRDGALKLDNLKLALLSESPDDASD